MPAIDLGDREAAEHQDAQHQLDALHGADQGAAEERPSHDIEEGEDHDARKHQGGEPGEP